MSIICRPFWLKKIQDLWNKKSIIWLSGVRRVGKTTISKQIQNTKYFNCDLPSVRRQIEDPEFFLSTFNNEQTLILDEIHQISNPSELLKIAADEYPNLKIITTGSSTLAATKKFRDSLSDRKRDLFLPPILWSECQSTFNLPDLDRRLLHGGLPPALLSECPEGDFYEEWLDSYFARDVQELFSIRNRTGFLKLLSLIIYRSGGLLDVSDLAKESEISRPTVMSYLDAMEISHTLYRLPPYSNRSDREIKKQPKIYAFDTGFICHVRGWQNIRNEDRGHLWENLVLDELRTKFSKRSLHFWRNKSKREIDFVIEKTEDTLDTVEAKINPDKFNPENCKEFRKNYPKGLNYVVSPYVDESYKIKRNDLEFTICSIDQVN